MIYASGIVTFLMSEKQFYSLENFKHTRITLKKKQNQSINSNNEIIMRASYDFSAILPRNYECRSLEDYTGKIKPYLEKGINVKIVSVQVSHLNYLSEQAISAIRKENK